MHLANSRRKQPTTRLSGTAKDGDVGLVIGGDVSLSMSHRGGVESRFERARGRVREILSGVEPGNPVTLVLMGNRSRILTRNVGYDPKRFEQVLRDLDPLPEKFNLEYCLSDLPALSAVEAGFTPSQPPAPRGLLSQQLT